jgi:hypothetical protein
MQMKLMRKRRNRYALFFLVSVCLVLRLGAALMVKAAFVFGALSITSLILLVRQNRLFFDAVLIWDNRILAVPSGFISKGTGRGKIEDTVVSTFGILIGSRIYRWGCDGVRLIAIEIDRARMDLTFGDGVQTMRVELLHGIGEHQAVLDVKQKLLHETGVKADISRW